MKILLKAILFFVPVICFSASFDCSKATTATEFAICDNPRLSTLDDLMATAYYQLLREASNKEKIRKEQFAFLTSNKRCNGNLFCLEQNYNERTTFLRKQFDDERRRKLSQNDTSNTDRNEIDREREKLAEDRRRLEIEKRRQEQAINQQENSQNNSNFSTDSRRRFALVIGNSNYSTLPKLLNTINDARVISQSLRSTGFKVTTYENIDLAGMQNAIRTFGEQLGKNDVGLVYYAGHGVQVRGKNYLVPVRENIKKSFEVPANAIDVDLLLATLENVKNDLNIVILDACRSPFPGESRGASRGLATMEAGKGTFVAFATAPGKEASDGSGSNSPYTKHLSRLVSKKGLALEQVFKEVRKAVVYETNGEQVPWENSSLMGDFYFAQ